MRQVQQLGWAAQRNLDLQEGWEMTEEHLQHSGINVDGVVNQIRRRLEHVRGTAVLSGIDAQFISCLRLRCTVAPTFPPVIQSLFSRRFIFRYLREREVVVICFAK